MTTTNLAEVVLDELEKLIAPLRRAIKSEVQRAALLSRMGWDAEALPAQFVSSVAGRVEVLGTTLDGLRHWIDRPPETVEEVKEVVGQTQEVLEQLRDLKVAPPAGFPDVPQLSEDLADLLIADYVERYHPVLFAIFTLLGVFQAVGADADQVVAASDPSVPDSGDRPVRLPAMRWRLRFDRIPALLSSPSEVLNAEYPIGSATNPEDATAHVERLLHNIVGLLQVLGARALTSAKSEHEVNFGAAGNSLARRSLHFSYPFTIWSTGAEARIGATVLVSPSQLENLGVVVFPFGQASFSQAFPRWALDVEATGTFPAFQISDATIDTLGAASSGALRATVRVLPADGETAAWSSSTAGLKISVEQLSLRIDCAVGGADSTYGVALVLDNCLIEVGGTSSDGFLSKVIPAGGIRAQIGLTAGWANDRGLYLAGSGTFAVTIPVHRSVGPFTLDSLTIGIGVDDRSISVLGAVTAGAEIGPLAVSVERVGLIAEFPLDDAASNRLNVDLLPPTGAGLVVDAGGITGGGFLSFDRHEGRYDGVLQLRFEDIGLTAIGLISTKLPDGRPGFALLISIGVTFSPAIQMSFGFVLSAVGGLLCVNRRMDVEVLRSGLRTGALDSVLFPENPVRDAPQILSTLRTAFPIDEGRYVVGPMVTIGWGSPPIITADIGIFIEVPSPILIVLLGQIAAAFPTQDDPVVELHVDVLGELNPAKRKLSIDASLHHSKILAYALSGDAALRWRWGDDALFVMSLGGFHPKFRDKPGDVDLRRLTLSLSSSSSFVLRCTVYQALTSNTLQFGRGSSCTSRPDRRA